MHWSDLSPTIEQLELFIRCTTAPHDISQDLTKLRPKSLEEIRRQNVLQQRLSVPFNVLLPSSSGSFPATVSILLMSSLRGFFFCHFKRELLQAPAIMTAPKTVIGDATRRLIIKKEASDWVWAFCWRLRHRLISLRLLWKRCEVRGEGFQGVTRKQAAGFPTVCQTRAAPGEATHLGLQNSLLSGWLQVVSLYPCSTMPQGQYQSTEGYIPK